MLEQDTKADRLVSVDASERLEALQEEVDLLKNEIKQNLMDLREHVMKGRAVFAMPLPEPTRRPPAPAPMRPVPVREISAKPEANGQRTVPLERPHPVLPASAEGLDPVMMGNIIAWLGTVKQMGLSLQQVTPYLEAYEAGGFLPPIMLKLLLRSLADLDQMAETPKDQQFLPDQYADCIGQLHGIICAGTFLSEPGLSEPALSEPALMDADLPDLPELECHEVARDAVLEEPPTPGEPAEESGEEPAIPSNYKVKTVQVNDDSSEATGDVTEGPASQTPGSFSANHLRHSPFEFPDEALSDLLGGPPDDSPDEISGGGQ